MRFYLAVIVLRNFDGTVAFTCQGSGPSPEAYKGGAVTEAMNLYPGAPIVMANVHDITDAARDFVRQWG